MATNLVIASNLTKYNAGGSGDNIVADGYIRTVEKVWIDSYTMVETLTNTTISLAVLPDNKKLTSVVVMIDTSASQTSGTVALGWASDADGAGWGDLMSASIITHNATTTTLTFPASGGVAAVVSSAQNPVKISGFAAVVSGTRNTVALKLNNWTMTTGTIRSIVRYT